jgi:peptide/nickel transport system permease protein
VPNLLGFLVRRLLWGIAVVAATTLLTYGGIRALRPDLTPGEPWLPGTLGDLGRVFLHFELGDGCFQIGCPSMASFIERFWTGDVFLLAGTFALGVTGGVAAGIWCAIRPRASSARALEALAMVFYCTPVYVVGLGLLLLFAPPFGIWPFQPLFELHQYISPWSEPITFLRAMLVPWLVCAAPLAAVCLRLTLASIVEVEHEDYIRTALAKGLSWKQAIRRHAAPSAYVPVSAYLAVSVPMLVTNMVLVEIVFNVPGVFRFTKRAITGPYPPGPNPDYEALQAIAVYAAVFIVVATILADLAVALRDPRVRQSRKALG